MSAPRHATRHPLVEVAATLLNEAGGALPIVSLNKALFYSDLVALRDLGETLTGQGYIALKAGPVVASYERRVIGALERAGIAQQDELDDGTKPVCLISEFDPKNLSRDQLEIVRSVSRWVAHKSPSFLSDFSHQNPGWLLAWNRGLGGGGRFAQPVNMHIAMQQIIGDDPWLAADMTSEEREVFVIAGRQNTEATPF